MKATVRILLCAMLLVGLLAGCGAETPQPPATTQPQIAEPSVGGMLLFNANAAVEIIYDSESFVMEIRGADTNGKDLVAAQGDVLGKDITDVVQSLTTSALNDGYLVRGEKSIVIKHCLGSELPGTAFMENILVDIQTVADGFPVIAVNESMLDEMGYITVDACKELLATTLDMDVFEEIEVNPETENGRYVMHLPIDGRTAYYTVDFNTGTVRTAELSLYDEDAMNGVEPEDVIYNPGEANPDENESIPEDSPTEFIEEIPDDTVPESTVATEDVPLDP